MSQILKAGVLLLMATSAHAGVSAAEADRLGKDLTPIGAERGASADGLIPAWQGKSFFTQAQLDVSRPALEALRRSNSAAGYALLAGPLADDKPRVVITRANMSQYAAQLTEGHKAMFRLYADYKMPVYPTVRNAFFPDQINAATRKNATSASLQGTDDLTGAAIGFPFPIPKTGAEVIWNHRLKYRGNAVRLINNSAIVAQDGGVQQSRFVADVKFVYANYKNPAPADNKLALYFSAKNLAPARVAGQSTLVHEPIMGSRAAWLFDPGIGRVRRAPDVGFDNPTLGADGEQFNDQVDTFNGSLERYDWKLLGKKPMLIAYNSQRIESPQLKIKDILRVKLHHLPEWNARRASIAARYLDALQSAPLTLPTVIARAESSWHLFVVRVPQRDAVQQKLQAAGINTLIHYPIPPHRQQAYAGGIWRAGDFPIAEQVAGEVLSLPMGPHLKAADVERVISALQTL